MSQDTVETSAPPAATPNANVKSGAKRNVRKRRSPWPTRLAILGVLGGLIALAPRALKKPPVTVDTVRVERGEVRDEISSSTAGEVMAEHSATVRAEASGRVLAVRHKRGERVKRGELIVALDSADADARLKQAQATLEAQRAQAAQADAHTEAAEKSADRMKRLLERGAGTTQAAEDSESVLREARAAARSSHALFDQSAAAVQVARVARGRSELTAPFDGLLSDVPVNPGDELSIGALVFQIVDDSRLHVEATIDEADIGRVRVGQPATLRLDALPEHPIPGRVSKLDPTVRKDEKGARTLRLEVAVTDLPGAVAAGLRPGMSANVDVRVADKADVLSLPSNVIIGRGTRRAVYVVDNGFARERTVEIGMSSWERAEIVSGLHEGDEVVATLNAKDLADGVAVARGKQAKRP